MDGFNLYREAKDHYEKLIPEKKDGLVLLSLYSKYKEKNFSEDNIKSIINKIYKDQGKDSNRTEYERNNNIILRLQDSFLWRDEINKTYEFKKYGLEFCNSIDNRLQKNYSPAKIKRWFDELFSSLENNIEKEENFNIWIEDHFDVRKPAISAQIEILDQQVNESVKEFKINIKSENESILELLKQIEIGLLVIKEQTSELRKAFQISYDIDDILTNILEGQNAIDYIENIKKVQQFHDKSRSQLEQVSNRIEKIKPRIREFIYDFNKKDFDRKTDKFINYILINSFTKKENNYKRINLPNNVNNLKVKDKTIISKFNVIPLREISPKLPIKLIERKIDLKERKVLLNRTLKWKSEKDRVSFWSKEAFSKINSENKLEFSPFFFQIIEKDNFNIAVKTTHKILRDVIKQKIKYQLTIDKESYSDSIINNVSIWQMTIQKK